MHRRPHRLTQAFKDERARHILLRFEELEIRFMFHGDGGADDENSHDENSHDTEDDHLLAQFAYLSGVSRASSGLAAQAASDPAAVGSWGAVMNWPVEAIHAQMLPTGHVMMWDRNE